MTEWFANLGAIASMLGLILTVAVFLRLRRIQRLFSRRARLPELTEAIGDMARDLLGQLRDPVDLGTTAMPVLARCESVLKSLSPQLEGNDRDTVFGLEAQIARFLRSRLFAKRRPLTRNDAWDLYVALEGIAERLAQIQKDDRWEN